MGVVREVVLTAAMEQRASAQALTRLLRPVSRGSRHFGQSLQTRTAQVMGVVREVALTAAMEQRASAQALTRLPAGCCDSLLAFDYLQSAVFHLNQHPLVPDNSLQNENHARTVCIDFFPSWIRFGGAFSVLKSNRFLHKSLRGQHQYHIWAYIFWCIYLHQNGPHSEFLPQFVQAWSVVSRQHPASSGADDNAPAHSSFCRHNIYLLPTQECK